MNKYVNVIHVPWLKIQSCTLANFELKTCRKAAKSKGASIVPRWSFLWTTTERETSTARKSYFPGIRQKTIQKQHKIQQNLTDRKKGWFRPAFCLVKFCSEAFERMHHLNYARKFQPLCTRVDAFAWACPYDITYRSNREKDSKTSSKLLMYSVNIRVKKENVPYLSNWASLFLIRARKSNEIWKSLFHFF